MNVLVAYESRGGHTKRAAEAIGEALRTEGHDAQIRPLSEVDPQEVQGADALFVGSWVEGFILFGVGPAKAARQWLERLPSLGGTPAGVFCTYAVRPVGTLGELRRGLEGRGAKVVAERAFHRRRGPGFWFASSSPVPAPEPHRDHRDFRLLTRRRKPNTADDSTMAMTSTTP